jgi:tyrosine-protein phosphatase non-receptor type 23
VSARDLLYKYFGQLELLELRFSEIRVNFPWRDAFTSKLTTQSSIAFEKASIIFQIAATHSSIAASQSRSDPEGLKRAFYYLRTCAGMLTYINENFLHAPSTDLSRDVVKFLVGLIQAQATEVFLEKCVSEKKGDALVSKIAAQVAHLYTTLNEEVKEFMGKGIFERNWVTLIQVRQPLFLLSSGLTVSQIKSHQFNSVSQYYRALADNAAGKHGDALVRLTIAEKSAKEAFRLCESNYLTATPMSPNMPADAGMCLQDIAKAQQAICAERKAEAQRDNDLIYNAVLPAPETLPAIEKAGGGLAAPIPIQDVYSTPEVQKVIGPDLFVRLVPLSVHESASVYSEEKAKLVRGEVEKADTADVEARSAVEASGVRDGLVRFKAMAEGSVVGEDELPVDVKRAKQDIAVMEEREGVAGLMARLDSLKDTVKNTLDSIGRDLETESRDCEAMRVKYEHLWTQDPSATFTKTMRQDLKSHLGAFDVATASDKQVLVIWNAVRNDIHLLLSPQVEDVFRASTEGDAGQQSLLDLDVAGDTSDQERARIGQYVYEIETRLEKMDKISKERHEILKELKEKVIMFVKAHSIHC